MTGAIVILLAIVGLRIVVDFAIPTVRARREAGRARKASEVTRDTTFTATPITLTLPTIDGREFLTPKRACCGERHVMQDCPNDVWATYTAIDLNDLEDA